MDDYSFEPLNEKVNIQARSGNPLVAFQKFVAPGLGHADWIEDSKYVTNTGMSMREWAGLVIHSLSLMNLTGQTLQVAKGEAPGDGLLVRPNSNPMNGGDCVYVEQTLATHRGYKTEPTLLKAIKDRLKAKSSRGSNYSENTHLVIWCNVNGEFNTDEIAKIVAEGAFNIVDIIGFNGEYRFYKSLVFDRHKGKIHEFNVLEKNLL
jgi:hypothetical protein